RPRDAVPGVSTRVQSGSIAKHSHPIVRFEQFHACLDHRGDIACRSEHTILIAPDSVPCAAVIGGDYAQAPGHRLQERFAEPFEKSWKKEYPMSIVHVH